MNLDKQRNYYTCVRVTCFQFPDTAKSYMRDLRVAI